MRNLFDMLNNIKLGREIFEPKISHFTNIRHRNFCMVLNFRKFKLFGRRIFVPKIFRFTGIILTKICTGFEKTFFLIFTSIRLNNFCKILDNRFAVALSEGPYWAKFNTRKVAFTLAEVLITIAIVGAVAAMTLPNLIQKQREQIIVRKVQRIYSILSQAYRLAIAENGAVSDWGIIKRDNYGLERAENAILIRDKLISGLKISLLCDTTSTLKNCGVGNRYIKNGGLDAGASVAGAQLSDGTSLVFVANTPGNNNTFIRGSGPLSQTFGLIGVDINGLKKPNTNGRDYFVFNLTNDGIIPQGTELETDNVTTFAHCYSTGRGCTAWVIKQNNMNYLHSSKCSWTNPSCK